METAISHLNSSLSIIRNAIELCNPSETGGTDYPRGMPGDNSPTGTGSTEYPRQMPGDNSPSAPTPGPTDLPGGNIGSAIPGVPEEIRVAVTPEQSWTVEAGAFGGVEGLPVAASVGADSSIEITQMSDGSFQIRNSNSANVSGGIAGNGVEGGQGFAITYSVSAEELAYLKEKGLPIPDGIIPPGTDSSNVDANPFNNIQGVEASSYAELALHDLDIPEGVSTTAQDFFNADLPDGVSAAAGGEAGFEARRNQFGEWEIVQNVSVEGSYDFEEHEEHSGGIGGFLNDISPIEINNTTTTGEKIDYKIEQVFNVETGEGETRVIETKTTFTAEGDQVGFDIPLVPGTNFIPDSVPGSQYIPELEHTVVEGSAGETTTVTTETVYDSSGNEISQNESSSNGTFAQGESNFVVVGADVQTTHEEHDS